MKRARSSFEPDTAGRALLMIVTPLLVGGAIALAMTGMTPLDSWLRGVFGGSRQRAMRDASRRFTHGAPSMSHLRRAIVGSAKRAIVSVFGPPRTATMVGPIGPGPTFWNADTWYYPIDGRQRSAMAIRFAGNVAAEVEFLTVPASVSE